MKIVFIGSGNLATQLSQALQRSGGEIVQIYSRTLEHAQCLAELLHCDATDRTDEIFSDADVYFFAVKDDALPELLNEVSSRISLNTNPSTLSSKLFLHTAGSMPMSVFEGHADNYGVFYPMQTFSKTRDVDFKDIPVFIEWNNEYSRKVVTELANSVSNNMVNCDSEKRKYLHLAAVFACNMTNHCYRLCEQILDEQGLDFNLFLPLIKETARKVEEMSPKEAQTGPMVRYDKVVMDKHLSLLKNPLAKEIYSLMAKSVHEDIVCVHKD